ncbi:MAG: hypothetical protein SFW08_11080 [Gemmatimonadaceae bacterium]|nr:hypothetical protein [Gemmatimonadaceae bacterium]
MTDLERQRQQVRRIIAVVIGAGGLVTLGAALLLARSTLDNSLWEAVGVALVPVSVGLVSLYAARRLWRAPTDR